jgi:hypothetical protein
MVLTYQLTIEINGIHQGFLRIIHPGGWMWLGYAGLSHCHGVKNIDGRVVHD